MKNSHLLDQLEGSEIAIIGMALRLPGARTPEALWQNLRDGLESVVFLSDEELLGAGVHPALLQNPDYVRACVPLDDFDKFDANFFGFSPKDAAIMDPQHRIFLECAWEAVENAGYDAERYPGAIGVYGGCGMNAYLMYNLLSNPDLMATAGEFMIRHTGNDKDFLTTRVSYNLNLKGPSVNVQTACSTSLVAVHLACQSLLNVECDMALAGGVTINLPNRVGYLYRAGEVASPDGHCRAFDVAAEGTLFGSGAAIVVLKRLKDAILDGDTIQAIIKGSAINNDGSMKVGYLAPSVEGQAKAIAEAIAVSGVGAETITYIEAHGTGTAIGDPIEIAALTQAFRADTDKKQYCAIGSLKTNIGHLDTAAGIAGLIKTTLALKHRALPASLHFNRPNPRIDFAESPFYVNSSYRQWKTGGTPRRAGVSSLGVGGTNAHVILEETPPLNPSGSSRPYQLILTSTKTASALDQASTRLADYLSDHQEIDLADAAYTLQTGRKEFEHRRALVCDNLADAIHELRTAHSKRVYTGMVKPHNPQVVFMFPGGGAQYPNMGLELYRTEPVYREAVDTCLDLLKTHLDYSLKALMFPKEEEIEAARTQLEAPLNSVLSVFITEYALARMWMSWGVKPAMMTGHSLGEYTAACLSGVMSLEDALMMVTFRGQLFEQLPPGAMLSMPLPESEVRQLLNGDLAIAAINSPSLTVVSGKVEHLNHLEEKLAAMEVECSRVKIGVAAHSRMLEPFLNDFSRQLSAVKLNLPTLPFVSNTTGDWITDDDATDANYWVRQLRHTVRFADGIQKILENPDLIFIEVGPGTTLSSFVRQQPGATRCMVVASLPHPNEPMSSLRFILNSLGRLWVAGQPIDWRGFYAGESRQRIPLPGYPFERQRYWIEPGAARVGEKTRALIKNQNISEWFYRPVWKQKEVVESASEEPLSWLIFADESNFATKILQRFEGKPDQVTVVTKGEQFTTTAKNRYAINPARRDDYSALVNELMERGRVPHRILYLWTASHRQITFEENLDESFYYLLYLAQALGEHERAQVCHLGVISTGMQRVVGEPVSHPAKALLMGPCRVIPQEYERLTCASIDIESPDRGKGLWGFNRELTNRLIDQLIREARLAPGAEVVALRRDGRWVREFETVSVSQSLNDKLKFKEQGAYLITGGLGGIGLVMAEMLAAEGRVKLTLVSRMGLPEREQWARWLELYDDDDETCQRIKAVQKLEAAGAEVFIAQADVTDLEQLRRVVAQTRQRFGRINGVIHAAGVTDDELIQFKTRESARRVLEPKIKGALALDEVLRKEDMDFQLLFSSTSSLVGWAGQIDYAAANAFLDAFAHSKSSSKCFTAAINFGIWQQVGMAARAANRNGRRNLQPDASNSIHPLLGQAISESPDSLICETLLSSEQWIVREHRLKDGEAVVPGTAYIEMARAAFEQLTGSCFFRLFNLTFLSPLVVAEDERREMRVSLRKQDKAFAFAVASRALGETRWQEHAQATLAGAANEALAPYPMPAILDRCKRQESCKGIERQTAFLHFGPRWKNYQQMACGSGEAVALLKLDEQFHTDLPGFKLHPALLDIATSFALSLIPGFDEFDGVYVPVSYGKLVIREGLKAAIYSHAICRTESDGQKGIASFDVTITDAEGNILVEVEEFVMRRIARGKALLASASTASLRPADKASLADHANLSENSALAFINQGISPQEGAEAVRRILAGRLGPQVVVSSLSLQTLIEQSQAGRPQPALASGLKLERPESAGNYSPARNEVEKFLVKLWQELLGIEQIGIQDDFFDLGGHSLMAVRMFAKIKKAYKINLGLATLLTARTIAQLAPLLGSEKASQKFSCLVPIQGQGSRPPFFCIHGVGGNIVEYSHLSNYLSTEQPFYGIQSLSLNKKGVRLETIEEMAAHYIKEVRALQPQGPYYFGGSSLGGIIGYEMAQQLQQQGQEVALLALFDTYGRDYPRLLPTTTLLQKKIGSFTFRASLHWNNLTGLKGTDRRDYVIEKSRKMKKKLIRKYFDLTHNSRKKFYELLLPEVAALTRFKIVSHFRNSLKRILLPDEIRAAQRLVGHASLHYEIKPYTNTGKVVLFRATEQPPGIYDDALNGWGGLISKLDTCAVPGHHGAIIREPRVPTLARLLNQYLDEVQEACAAGVPEGVVSVSAKSAV